MKRPKEHVSTLPRPKMWDAEPDGVKRKSLDNEKRLSEKIGFKLTPGSGNREWAHMKGDGIHPLVMFEAKETAKGSISIAARDVGKLCREAATVGKEPAIILSAYGLPDPIPKDWVAVPASFFTELLRLAEVEHGQ